LFMPRRDRLSAVLPFIFFAPCCTLAALLAPRALHAQSEGKSANGVLFRNMDSSVGYVGSKSCGEAGCHAEIYREYFPSPHGRQMAPANIPADLARVAKPMVVFNPKNNRYYTVYQQDGDLYQSEFELDKKGGKLYDIAHKIDYVVGGEIVGYSYLFQLGPWMLQAPLSYYARSKTWELSPGYVDDDLGFTRVATTGCLMCHNGQPDPIPMRDGSYKEPPFRFGEISIGCETCHGPGALHVKELRAKKGGLSGTLGLGPREVDTSIVNPAHLSPRLADDICKECHQQGDTQVLHPGKTVLDYRPGQPLSDTIAKLTLPIKPEERAEANQLEGRPPVRGSLEQSIEWKNSALELSKCYQATHGQLTCGTCHSIHHEPKPGEARAAYRAACLTCHTVKSCTLKADDSGRVAAQDYCIQCHMEKRAVAGVAHSNDTKHRIVRYPGQPLPEVAFAQSTADLPGLLWVNRPESPPDARLPDVSQLEAYYTAARKDASLWPLWFRKLNELSKTQPDDPTVLNSLGAVALAEKKDNAGAAKYFALALKEGSEEPTTFMNLATALVNLGRAQAAEQVLERGVAAYPYYGQLTARLAQLYAMDGQTGKARNLVRQYLAVFPEDLALREAEKRLDGAESVDPLAAPGHTAVAQEPR
jgi:hypothetical protein